MVIPSSKSSVQTGSWAKREQPHKFQHTKTIKKTAFHLPTPFTFSLLFCFKPFSPWISALFSILGARVILQRSILLVCRGNHLQTQLFTPVSSLHHVTRHLPLPSSGSVFQAGKRDPRFDLLFHLSSFFRSILETAFHGGFHRQAASPLTPGPHIFRCRLFQPVRPVPIEAGRVADQPDPGYSMVFQPPSPPKAREADSTPSPG